MKFLASLILLILLSVLSNAQTLSVDDWRNGKVVLNNGVIHFGKIFYDDEKNVLIVKVDAKDLTFSADEIYKFELEKKYLGDGAELAEKVYFTIYEEDKYGIKTPSFYRVIIGGEISVLTKGFVLSNACRL